MPVNYKGSLKELCDMNNLNYNNVRAFKRKHKDISNEQIIELYKQMITNKIKRGESKESLCKKNKIGTDTVNKYLKEHSGVSTIDAINNIKNSRPETLKEKCDKLGLSRTAISNFKRRHNIQDNDQAIKIYMNIKNNRMLEQDRKNHAEQNLKNVETFKDKCIKHNINYNKARTYKQRHLELTDNQIIEYYIQGTFKRLCEMNNISYAKAIQYRNGHPELTDDQIIEYYETKVYGESFANKCHRYGINTSSGVTYRNRSKCTDEQAIIHFRPDLRLNALGEIIDDNR